MPPATLLPRAALLVLFGLAGSCRDGRTVELKTRILSPHDEAEPFADLDRIRIRVLQGGETLSSRTFDVGDSWSVPPVHADLDRRLQVRVEGLDASGRVVKVGRSELVPPGEAAGRVLGIYFSEVDRFSAPPALPAALRSDAAVTRLEDGRILMAGGVESVQFSTAVDLYDPDTGQWRSLAPLTRNRSRALLVELSDGRVLVAGGLGSQGLLRPCDVIRVPKRGDADDPGGVELAGELPQAARALQGARLRSGKVILAGGGDAQLGDPAFPPTVHDPDAGTFVAIEGAAPAEQSSVVALPDGRVAILGGDSPTANDDVSIVSDRSDGGIAISHFADRLRVGRYAASVSPLAGGRLLVAGGLAYSTREASAALEVLDLADAVASRFARERDRRHGSSGVAVPIADGRVLLGGGLGQSGSPARDAVVWESDDERGEATSPSDGTHVGSGFGVAMRDGTAWLLGGSSGDARIEIYNPSPDALPLSTRGPLEITPLLPAGESLEALAAERFRLRMYDAASQVGEWTFDAGLDPVEVENHFFDGPLHLTLEALSGAEVVAWGASAAAVPPGRQRSGPVTLLLGPVGRFVLAPFPLPSPHGEGFAAQLADGAVAVLGGLGGEAASDRFDPTDGATAAIASSVPTPRRRVAAARFGAGVLFAGGLDTADGPVAAADLFDLTTASWSTVAALPSPRAFHALVALADGGVLAHGAEIGGTPQALADRFAGASWSAAGTPTSRARHAAARLSDGKVLLTGGVDGNPATISAAAILYNPAGDAYAPTGPMQQARRDHAAFPVGAGGAVVCGGQPAVATAGSLSSCESFDGSGFDAAGSLSAARERMAVLSVANGETWMIGGSRGSADMSAREVDRYTDGVGLTAGPSLVTARSTPAVVRLSDGRIVVAGGYDEVANQPLASVEVYTPSTWRNPNLP